MENQFYTYAFLREDGTPYYIGKGKGNRAWKNRRTPPHRPKQDERIIILKKNLTETEAFCHEVYMISVLGRKENGTGILLNRAEGGQGPSGAIHSEEYRNKNRAAQTGMTFWSNPETGKTTYSQECPGKGWIKGHTDNMKKEKSKKQKGMLLWYNPQEECHTWSKSHPGEGWIQGMGPERRGRCANGRKGKKPHNRGLKCWHNPETNEAQYSSTCPGEGWKLGGKPRK